MTPPNGSIVRLRSVEQAHLYYAKKIGGVVGGVVGGVTRGVNSQTKTFRVRFSPLKIHKIQNKPLPYSKVGSIYAMEQKKHGGVVKNCGGVTRGTNLT